MICDGGRAHGTLSPQEKGIGSGDRWFMKKPLIDISPLKDACMAFSSALRVAKKVEAQDAGEREFYLYETCRASVIQHFEICYELSWKYMQRWLEVCNGDEVDGLSKKALFRLAQEKNLIADFEKWSLFTSARNRTSHIYDENVAEEVYSIAKESKRYADELLRELEARL
jgi:nucleotidyltransferase substrate binding protein (TIGR01987 family)